MEVTSRILSECFIRNLHGELDKQYPGGAVGVMWYFVFYVVKYYSDGL